MSTDWLPGTRLWVPGIILDTNVVSEILRPRPDHRVATFIAKNPTTLLTAITVGEMRYGVADMSGGRRRNDVGGAVEHTVAMYAGRILPFNESATKAYAEVVSFRRSAGRPICTADAMIAAIAMSRGLTLATRNTKDFDGLPLVLVDPWL